MSAASLLALQRMSLADHARQSNNSDAGVKLNCALNLLLTEASYEEEKANQTALQKMPSWRKIW
jgi:hypothetical protein